MDNSVTLDLEKKHTKMKVKSESEVAQSCLTLTVHGILQARILEWAAFPFSRGSS